MHIIGIHFDYGRFKTGVVISGGGGYSREKGFVSLINELSVK